MITFLNDSDYIKEKKIPENSIKLYKTITLIVCIIYSIFHPFTSLIEIYKMIRK